MVQNWSRIGRNRSGMVPKTSGTLLGHFWEKTVFVVKTSQNHETSTCLKTDLGKRRPDMKIQIWLLKIMCYNRKVRLGLNSLGPVSLCPGHFCFAGFYVRTKESRYLVVLWWCDDESKWAQMGPGPNEWAQMGSGLGPNEWAQWARAQQGPNESPRMGPNGPGPRAQMNGPNRAQINPLLWNSENVEFE